MQNDTFTQWVDLPIEPMVRFKARYVHECGRGFPHVAAHVFCSASAEIGRLAWRGRRGPCQNRPQRSGGWNGTSIEQALGMEYLWNIYGISMEFLWNIYGVSMEYGGFQWPCWPGTDALEVSYISLFEASTKGMYLQTMHFCGTNVPPLRRIQVDSHWANSRAAGLKTKKHGGFFLATIDLKHQSKWGRQHQMRNFSQQIRWFDNYHSCSWLLK